MGELVAHSLTARRSAVVEPNASGQPLSCQELAELVNVWAYDNISQRRVLVTAELGFRRPRRTRATVAEVDRQQFNRDPGEAAVRLTGVAELTHRIGSAVVVP
jgi:hypothetical protein